MSDTLLIEAGRSTGRTTGRRTGRLPRPYGGRAATVATLAVVAVATLARCWERVPADRIFSTSYDESVEYQAAVRMLSGSMPYEHFAFVHPPGSSILLLPFAALARVAGDATAMAWIHVLAVAIGVLNTLLLCLLLRRYGAAAVLTGGLAYACYFPVVAVDRAYLLEPLMNLMLLLALVVLFLRPRRHSPLVAGLLIGFSMTVKVWAFADAAVLAGHLLVSRGRRAALTFCAGFAAAATVVCLPFFVLAPFSMFRHVVLAQAGRPEVASQNWDFRLSTLNPLARVDGFSGVGWGRFALVLVALLTAGMVALLVRDRRAARRDRRPGAAPRRPDGLFVVAVALLLARTLTLLLGATFYRHYLAFPALAFCLGLGILAGRAAASVAARTAGARAAHRPLDRAVTGVGHGVAVLAVVGLAVLTVRTIAPVRASTAHERQTMQAWAASKDCVWGYGPGVVLSNAATANARHGCVEMVDRTGAALYLISRGHRSPAATYSTQLVYRNKAWERAAWREIEHSDGVVLDPASEKWILRSRYQAEFTLLFEKDGTASGWALWSRR